MKAFAVVPSGRLLSLVALGAGVALAAAGVRLIDAAWVAPLSATALEMVALAMGVTLLLALWDLSQVGRIAGIRVERLLPENVPVGGWTEVVLRIHHPFHSALEIDLFDHYPQGAEVTGLPRRLQLRPGQSSEVRYQIRPLQRGEARFGRVQLLIPSPLKLWSCSRLRGVADRLRVYPDFAAIGHYQLLATDNRASQLGIKRRPKRGEGLEFHQLRDYRAGDSLRQIDWKATVRRQKLISREYQEERDQQIFFLLDSGRRMRSQDGALSHFDHALNALLLLSHVALKQGDAVGLMSFGGVSRWLKPVKSVRSVNTILNSVYDLHPTTQASDYLAAVELFLRRQRKRSLVILLTNLSEESVEELRPALRLLRRHHLVLLANLREEALDQVLQQPLLQLDDALTYLGTEHYLKQRRQAQRQLLQEGVLLLDTTPTELAVKVVNSYLEIKRAGAL